MTIPVNPSREMSMKFRSNIIEVEAMHHDSTRVPTDIAEWCGGRIQHYETDHGSRIILTTRFPDDKQRVAHLGDWIVRGPDGQFWACPPDVFEVLFEIASQ